MTKQTSIEWVKKNINLNGIPDWVTHIVMRPNASWVATNREVKEFIHITGEKGGNWDMRLNIRFVTLQSDDCEPPFSWEDSQFQIGEIL